MVDYYYFSAATYGSAEVAGVAMLVVAGAISLAAVVPVLAVLRWFGPKLANTRIMPFFVSLLVANVLQAIGTLINSRWVTERNVVAGHLCSAQGGIKQAGNVGMALWSFVLSLHVFMLLFVRRLTLSTLNSWVLLLAGWFLVAFVVAIGPTAIQTADRGPYFGPTGYWCWITHNYPREQFFLEYFFEFLSAGLSFCLYTAVLLRVRGNLVRTSGKWHLRFVPSGERWRLAIRRDAVDGCMMQVATRMVWYPVAYTILLLPVTIARFVAFGGHDVPFRATIFADFVFNLQGVVNVALLLATRRFVPDTASLPLFAPRQRVSMSSPEAYGITPFVLPPKDADSAEKGVAAGAEAEKEKESPAPMYVSASADDVVRAASGGPVEGAELALARSDSTSSTSSTDSANSQTPLVLHIR
ncbi:hypothetical protein L226DRAFT_455538 [Lentinus tigrinus ALCF2SS1-7]|uniref:Uncharacterized protein n=1 Tax=Lentinus tigrinus ALCF2SS1-6 TaxID=1328759 RepID=A0A5C2SPS6_9APHY|nr:hypothetical protein L227DRAFT_493772 [Lentinus tigrinus ALCF2SS1-6]RPD78942.1 hypothetical protein L226DRAFT_455538 [Lentinus tigrinus ALCF2SS1-7]